ncbi:hypothetical protein DCAR_0206316 [Daucus carota subsp. sativus]|uniref:Uncharacterized protein n=1 Tax=Daucus carota subsp. sativus TaxID=79200 RepID=A0A166D692_DAUCS|nr:hypothetical protein DCAR_0206316 [Daucus carota subsp. sativus]
MSSSMNNTSSRAWIYSCPRCNQTMALVGPILHAPIEPWGAEMRWAETHHENPFSVICGGSYSYAAMPLLPSATPASPAPMALAPVMPVPTYPLPAPIPQYHDVSTSLAPPPPASLNPPPKISLEAPPSIKTGTRFFGVQDFFGPSIAHGEGSSRPIVLDNYNKDEEENALDLDLKL